MNFLEFGYERVKLFRFGLNQPESMYFPRETFCDFHVREPLRGGEPLQRITVQCVLTVNLFNQVDHRFFIFFFSKEINSRFFPLANFYFTMDLVYVRIGLQCLCIGRMEYTSCFSTSAI